jgi:hypothetical protein
MAESAGLPDLMTSLDRKINLRKWLRALAGEAGFRSGYQLSS